MAKRKQRSGKALIIPVVIGAWLAVAHNPPPVSGAAAPVLDSLPAAPLPSGCCTPAWWAGAFLAAAGLPQTACNVSAVEGWQHAEGTYGEFLNPLDTTQPEPGSWSVNSVGVQHFTSWSQGIHATVVTLFNGSYPGIIAALRAGSSAQAVANAVGSSPWGTGHFAASC